MKRQFLFLMTVFLGSLGSGVGPARGADDLASWKSWVEQLPQSGYSVSQGGTMVVDTAACSRISAVFGSCFGNNAAAPYIVPEPPIDGTTVNGFYGPYFTEPGATGAPSNMLYRLADTDALVTLVQLPPQAAYLGYQSYLFTREAVNYSESPTMQVVSPDPARYEIFGSFGNDINNTVIKNRLGAAWDNGVAVYITTANENLSRALVANARARGFNQQRIFVEPIGANILTGTGASADDMVTLIRYALPRDQSAADTWRNNAAGNVLVFRVSAAAGRIGAARFATPVYTPRESASEATYSDSLKELAVILWRWLARHEGRPAVITDMITSVEVDETTGAPHGLVGGDCIAKGSSCLGDNQDTDSYRLAVIGRLKENGIAIMAGVNHARADNADYISLAVYNMATFTGVASASQTNPASVGFNSGTLNGSAEGVLRALGLYGMASPQLKAQLPYFYTALLERSCTVAPAYCLDLSDLGALPLNAIISVTQRAYVKPGTTTGANPNVMLSPLVIFRPIP
jgi:hypothetical protein